MIAACDVLSYEMANMALANADPFKRWPIFVPTHKACFMSPDQFIRFYWPSFKKTLEILIDAGHTVRAYLEGDWGHHWHHMLELPKGKVLCDIDNQGDIFKAKKDIGHHQCIAGGIKDSQFILGTPRRCASTSSSSLKRWARGRLHHQRWVQHPLHHKAGKFQGDDRCGHGIRHLRSKYKAPAQRADSNAVEVEAFKYPKMVTPWAVKRAELGGR